MSMTFFYKTLAWCAYHTILCFRRLWWHWDLWEQYHLLQTAFFYWALWCMRYYLIYCYLRQKSLCINQDILDNIYHPITYWNCGWVEVVDKLKLFLIPVIILQVLLHYLIQTSFLLLFMLYVVSILLYLFYLKYAILDRIE